MDYSFLTNVFFRSNRLIFYSGCLIGRFIRASLKWLSLCLQNELTHWSRVTHLCVGNLTTVGSDNGLSPGRRQAIIWTNARILLIGFLWTNFSQILIEFPTFSFKKMRLKVSSAKWWPFCLGLNVLSYLQSPHWQFIGVGWGAWVSTEQPTSHYQDNYWRCSLIHMIVTKPLWIKQNIMTF